MVNNLPYWFWIDDIQRHAVTLQRNFRFGIPRQDWSKRQVTPDIPSTEVADLPSFAGYFRDNSRTLIGMNMSPTQFCCGVNKVKLFCTSSHVVWQSHNLPISSNVTLQNTDTFDRIRTTWGYSTTWTLSQHLNVLYVSYLISLTSIHRCREVSAMPHWKLNWYLWNFTGPEGACHSSERLDIYQPIYNASSFAISGLLVSRRLTA